MKPFIYCWICGQPITTLLTESTVRTTLRTTIAARNGTMFHIHAICAGEKSLVYADR